MKLGLCMFAFAIGCLCAVVIRTGDSAEQTARIISGKKQLSTMAHTQAFPEAKTRTMKLEVKAEAFGNTQNGTPVEKYICHNVNGLSIEVVTYGATLAGVYTPDRSGKFDNIVLGCEDIDSYQAATCYLGSSIGRFCNRIAAGKFSLDGTDYQLTINNGDNHLHGGTIGFNRQVWSAEQIIKDNAVGVRMGLVGQDGDQGYPGRCTASVTYLIDNDNQLTIEYAAEADQATIVNLTNHAYWNLDGAGAGLIGDHQLQIEADQVLEFDPQNLPTGKRLDVAGTRFDFTSSKNIDSESQQSAAGDESFAGYDHNFILRQSGKLSLAAKVSSRQSGRQLTVSTTQPGLQLYTGNFLNGLPGSGGFDKQTGFCLETQHFPDSPNHPEFPSTVLRPGQQYHQTTVWAFSIAE